MSTLTTKTTTLFWRTLSTSLILLLVISSCSEEVPEPINGVDGINGFNALVNVEEEIAGENCSSGGVKISVGQDTNNSGTLDPSEVLSISFVCSGTAGNDGEAGQDGFDLVARTSAESPGVNCENGGTLVQIGADVNNNSTLEDDEVQTSYFVCNGMDGTNGQDGTDGSDGTNGQDGADGMNGLTSIVRVTPSASCSNGGLTLDIGLDSNGNAELDTEEINASYDICNGADGTDGTDGADGSDGANGTNGLNTLSNVISEPAGTNCANGGLKIQLGLDTNNNGSLDVSEVVSENFVCNGTNGTDGADGSNGTDGTDGISSVTRVTVEAAGANCANGGLKLEIGMDDISADGVLEDGEVEYTYYVCNGVDGSSTGGGSDGADGADGLTSLIKTTNENAGANCANSGIKIEVGLDSDRSGTLDAGEIMNTFYICNGLDGVDGTNGSDGADGADGVDGRDLMVVTSTDVSCTNGGVEFTFGYDNDNNGSIDEVVETALICNGVNGTDGADGADGTNGLNSIIETMAESPGANCPNGGLQIRVGLDANSNGSLDAGEFTTNYVCNGNNGSDGQSVTVQTSFASCGGAGGTFIRLGYDNNSDGDLTDAGDVLLASFTLCNGDDGSNGSDGQDGNSDGVFEFYFANGFDDYNQTIDATISEATQGTTQDTEILNVGVNAESQREVSLLQFAGVEKMTDIIGEEFYITEAILYVRAFIATAPAGDNWIGVKGIRPGVQLFDQTKVTWADGWTKGGYSGDDVFDFSDVFRIPSSFVFSGNIPLLLDRSLVTSWLTVENNKGVALEIADNVRMDLNIYSSENRTDIYFVPTLYIKAKTGRVSGRVSQDSHEEYITKWNKKTYQEKLAPFYRRK